VSQLERSSGDGVRWGVSHPCLDHPLLDIMLEQVVQQLPHGSAPLRPVLAEAHQAQPHVQHEQRVAGAETQGQVQGCRGAGRRKGGEGPSFAADGWVVARGHSSNGSMGIPSITKGLQEQE
jgi:hypothetical protein